MGRKQFLNTKAMIAIIALFVIIILAAAGIALVVGPSAPAEERDPSSQSGNAEEPEDPVFNEIEDPDSELEYAPIVEGDIIDDTPVTYNKPDEMRAVYLTPGEDFLTSKPMAVDKLKAEIDLALANAVKLTMNTVIIDTNATESVIYKNDVFPVTSADFDIMGYIVEKARAKNLYVYAIFDVLQEYDGAALSQPGAVTAEVMDNITDALLGLTEYNIDGVLMRSYYNEVTSSSYADYLRAGGSIGFENYMAQVPENAVRRVYETMRTKARGIQLGVLTDPVWMNASQHEAGSKTNAAFTTLGSGNADVKGYIEDKLVDFVAVEAYGSLADGAIPFETVTKWWSDLCIHQGVDMYVVQYSSRMCSSYTGWSSPDELAKQYTQLKQLDGWSGSIFNSLSRLVANPSGGTDTLVQVFKDEINPDFLFTELTISKPEKTEFSTEERNVTFAGGSDPTKPVTINGKEIETDDTGFFSVTYELKAGKNVFVIAHKEKTLTYTVTRNITIIKSVEPTGNLTVDGGMDITVSALAYEGAKVTATLNGQTITLKESEDDDDSTDKESSYVKFVGTLTVPEATSKVQNLGQIVFKGVFEGDSMSMKGAHVSVNKVVNIGDGEPIVVTAAQAETFPTSRLDDISDPEYYPLPKGTLDYAVGDQIVYKDSTGTFTYNNLASGLRVYSKDISSTNKSAGKNVIKGLKVDADKRYTTVTLFSAQPVSYVMRYTSSGIKINFQNTTTVPGNLTLTKNPLFSAATWSGSTLTLKLKSGFVGYKASVDGNNIVFRFSNPISIGAANIVVDAGHGGGDPGAVSFPGMTEADINYAIATKLVDELESLGANVKLIGHDTTRVAARTSAAESYNANLYVAVHCNAAGSSATGSEAYYFRPWASSLASKVSGGIANGLSTTNRGGKYGLYYVTRVTQYPSILAECGFITNQSEFKKLCTSSYQSKVAARMAVAIEDYMSSMGGSSLTGVQSVGSTDLAAPTGITLTPTTLNVAVGETAAITAAIQPANADQTVVWTSSDAKIAKVDETGKVTGVKLGKATITAETSNGKKATCEVTVTEAYTIALNKTELTLAIKGTETLTAAIKQGSTAVTNQKVVWTSGDSKIAKVDSNGKVTAVKEGEAVIIAAMEAYPEKTATCKVIVTKELIPVTQISLNKTSVTLEVGAAETLTAAVTPDNATDKTVKWTSSNTSIATVDSSGKVTAVKEGQATITATANDGSGIKATCGVTVAAAKVAVESVALSDSALELKAGETKTLTATVKPDNAADKTVTWSSSDKSVATVDNNGKVTAVKEGQATITATANDGSGKSASCTVTVTAAQTNIPVSGVTLNKSEAEGKVGDTIKLSASVAPGEATDQTVSWSSSDDSVATVDSSGKVTIVGSGSVTITVTTKDGGFTASCTITVEQQEESSSQPESSSEEPPAEE
ncbi:MAG: Ig-like domain-containing protein [Oscillospiraceae bacterium]|nr:Ig-like domain-containing protein [Oscillospiraceae bacterium]